MAKALSFEVVGLRKLDASLNNAKSVVFQIVDQILNEGANEITINAVSDAPRRKKENIRKGGSIGGSLSQSITRKKIGPLSYRVGSSASYAVYVEFGTGDYASTYVPSLPIEIQEYARQFKQPNLNNISMPAQPFLYPNVRKQTPIIVADLRAELKAFL